MSQRNKFERIFIPNNNGHDYEQTLIDSGIEYEEIIFMTTDSLDIFNVSNLLELVDESVNEISNDDAIIIGGSVVLNFLIGICLGKQNKYPAYLVYSPVNKVYRIRRKKEDVNQKHLETHRIL